jgi:hypothetical protein
MSEIYETNAPEQYPTPKEQPAIEEKVDEGNVFKTPPVKESVNRWRKEIIDKIQFLKDNWEETVREKEVLSQELDRVQSELAESRERVKTLEQELTETLENFNRLLNEVSQALE